MDADRGSFLEALARGVARRPAVPAAGLFIGGIVLHDRLPTYPLLEFAAVALCLLAGFRLQYHARRCSACLGLALLLCGLLAGQLAAFYYPTNHISQYAAEESRLAQIELKIDRPPRVLSNPFDKRRPMPPKQVATASVSRILTWSGWADCTGDVLLQIAEPNPQLAAGQTVRALAMLQRPSPAMNPGQFDWDHYYREQRVLASVSIHHANDITLLHDDGPSLLTAAREKVRRWLAMGFPADRALDHALLRALLVGDNDPNLRDVQEEFQRTGTSHHLSISGLHIAVLGGFVFLICRLLCVPPRWSASIVLAFVIGYGLLALPSPPVVRSVLLCTALAVGLLARRSGDAIQLLAVSVFVMLVYHPPDVYSAGFQLSFGTVLGLMLFSGPMEEFITGFRDRDMMIARSLVPRTSWGRVRDRVGATLLAGASTGLVAWGVSMPLIAYHFEQLNPWAIFAGIFLAPIVFAALIGGLLKVVLTVLWPGLSAAWVVITAWPIVGMRWGVDLLAKWPGADVPVPPPPIWLIALFYLMLLPALFKQLHPGWKWFFRIGRVLTPLFMLVLPLQRAAAQIAPGGEARVTLLAVGAGQCAVVQPPGGRTVLLDAGSSSLSDLLGKCLGPFLRHAGCTQVDTVLMSHTDYDHISAVGDVVQKYGVREVLTAVDFAEHARASPRAEELTEVLARLDRPPRVVGRGDVTPLATHTAIEVLWPPKQVLPGVGSNDTSMVVRLTHAGRSILFSGDIQDIAMRELLREPARLKSDVLIAPHHGSSETKTAEFVRAVNPTVILSSNDRTLSGKQVAFEKLIGRRTLLRTNRDGAITVIITRSGAMVIQPFLGKPVMVPENEKKPLQSVAGASAGCLGERDGKNHR